MIVDTSAILCILLREPEAMFDPQQPGDESRPGDCEQHDHEDVAARGKEHPLIGLPGPQGAQGADHQAGDDRQGHS